MQTRGTVLVLASFALLATYTHASNWVVETNSFRVKEPNDLRGEYDVAIGDVRPFCREASTLLIPEGTFCQNFCPDNHAERCSLAFPFTVLALMAS